MKKYTQEKNKKCTIDGCEMGFLARGMCSKHYTRFMTGNDVNKKTLRDPQEYVIKGDIAEIIIRDKGGNERCRAIIDTDSIEKVSKHKWCLQSGGYIMTLSANVRYLHQFILGKKDGYTPDHINRNQLDNRISNLRFATPSQNVYNRDVNGIYFNEKLGKWEARIGINKKVKRLGMFKDKEDAIKARRFGEIKFYKEFAVIR